ncbi:hypothetical protein PR001_g1767 [Phytophthora rubi]|uniref:Secreted protein n=1 Tax=Phytophthora rubi TaxID=129364 RepID=A0A6A3P7S6_9STRA|nr:hypothetical protein PR002_g5174 [Phytophthora rubi]KAE9051101.1 hypothetical protein PR001_g1767 [Phytophthora rubi]
MSFFKTFFLPTVCVCCKWTRRSHAAPNPHKWPARARRRRFILSTRLAACRPIKRSPRIKTSSKEIETTKTGLRKRSEDVHLRELRSVSRVFANRIAFWRLTIWRIASFGGDLGSCVAVESAQNVVDLWFA